MKLFQIWYLVPENASFLNEVDSCSNLYRRKGPWKVSIRHCMCSASILGSVLMIFFLLQIVPISHVTYVSKEWQFPSILLCTQSCRHFHAWFFSCEKGHCHAFNFNGVSFNFNWRNLCLGREEHDDLIPFFKASSLSIRLPLKLRSLRFLPLSMPPSSHPSVDIG